MQDDEPEQYTANSDQYTEDSEQYEDSDSKKRKITVSEYRKRPVDERKQPSCIQFELHSAPLARDLNEASTSVVYERPVTNPRDPRGRNTLQASSASEFVPLNRALSKRDSFIEGALSANDLIQQTPLQNVTSQSMQIMRKRSCESRSLLVESAESFRANISEVSRSSGGFREERSPLIVSNRNAAFMSQATAENAREVFGSQRYRNIPRDVQDAALQVGIGIDEISHEMRSPVHEMISSGAMPRQQVYQEMQSTIQEVHPEIISRLVPRPKIFENKAVQTTENDGIFSVVIDPKDLTKEQREALQVFKKVG